MTPEFTNPAGHIQGGFLAAMLDPERFDPSQVKFDDPRKRWKLAFAPPPPARPCTSRPPR